MAINYFAGRGFDGATEAQTVLSAVTITDVAQTYDWHSSDRHVVGVHMHYTQATGSKTCTATLKVSNDGTNWYDFSSNTLQISSGVSGGTKTAARFTPPPALYYRLSVAQSDDTASGTVTVQLCVTKL